MLTHQELLRRVHYAPETGVWTRLINGRRYKKGDRADRLMLRKQHFRAIMVDSTEFLAHRLAWFYMTQTWPPKLVDHKNLDATDNRWENLRLATKSQNAGNIPKHKDNTSGYKGVYLDKKSKNYCASIYVRGKKFCLGSRKTAAEASELYKKAALEHFGEFARHD